MILALRDVKHNFLLFSCEFPMLFNGNLRIEEPRGGMYVRTDGHKEIHPLEPLPKNYIFSSSPFGHLFILFLFLILTFLLMDRFGVQLDIIEKGFCCLNAKLAMLCTCAYILVIVCFSSTPWCKNIFGEE